MSVRCSCRFAAVCPMRNDNRAPVQHEGGATQAVTLPLYFISGVVVAVTALPHGLVNIADVFPATHLAAALLVG